MARRGLIGAGVGAGLGASYVGCNLAEENKASCRQTAMPLAAIGSGGLGFGAGALIGSAFKKNEPMAQIVLDPQTGLYGARLKMSF